MTLLAASPTQRAARPAPLTGSGRANGVGTDGATLVDALLAEQSDLSAVERFARAHERHEFPELAKHYRSLLPATAPSAGQQYAFEVDLDQCSGCKACVTACHSLNGLEEGESWRNVGLLISSPGPQTPDPGPSLQHHITTACHHCADPGCLNGCPVLAYDKDPVTGIVRHLDDQCIGCQYCVMKCPYEVPKYSERLGIVRKCDMCSNRLAVGEAPACVQACPNEAIRISLVTTATFAAELRIPNVEVRKNSETRIAKADAVNESSSSFELSSPFALRSSDFHPWLPDSPNPAITLPTTRYRSANPAVAELRAADHHALRLDAPHWPLAIMLVLTQAAAGLSLLTVGLAFAGTDFPTLLPVTSLVLLLVGMGAAFAHLGQPRKAWRAFLGWRRSWLSRELIAFNLFAVATSLMIGAQVSSLRVSALAALASWAPVLLGATASAAVFASAMVYVDTRRPFWCARITFGNFAGTTLLLGATFGAVIFGWLGNFTVAQPCAIAALIIRTVLFAWRRLELRAALRDAASSIHFNARVIRELLPGALAWRTGLFAASTATGLMAIGNVAGLAPVWASLAAATTFISEIITRHVFFVASASKRMPGGVNAS